MIGLESCFGAVNKVLTKDNKISHLELIKLLTVNPRKIMKLNQDLFKEGANAEIVIYDPNIEWKFSLENIYSKSNNSPYLNRGLKGKIESTIAKEHIASQF